MFFFILNCLCWILVLYFIILALYKIIQKKLFQNNKFEDTYLIIATKNSEKSIENLVRSILYTDTFCKENIFLVDMNSTDDTQKIVEKLNYKNEKIKIMTWKEINQYFQSF